MDPNFRPNVVDSFDFTIQRQLSNKITLEVGYIGRRITHEYQPINVNSVPYMMTMGGQTFAKAYANTMLQYCGGIAGLAGPTAPRMQLRSLRNRSLKQPWRAPAIAPDSQTAPRR